MFKKITIYSIMILFLVALISCDVEPKEDEDPVPEQDKPAEPINPIRPNDNAKIEGTVHQINVSLGTNDFFKSGSTSYVIVIPQTSTSYEELAANEIQQFIESATNVTLSIKKDDQVLQSDKFISLGKTSLSKSQNIDARIETFGHSGYLIKTIGDDVYIQGGSHQGTLYGGYEFLKHTIGFSIYAEDEIVFKQNIKDIKLPIFDVIDIPDIAWRTKNYGIFDSNIMFSHRSRMNLQEDFWIAVGGNSWHNSFNYISPNEYKDLHPEWFNNDFTQLDYTNDEMRAELTKRLIEIVDSNPDLISISITQEDYNTWATSSKALALKEKYGTDAASMIIFANEVSRSLKQHFASQGSDRIVEIVFFAYHRTEIAPTKYDPNTDTYAPIDDLVKADENVNVFFAPIFADYNLSIFDPVNKSMYDTMRAWTAITDKFYLWTYSTNFVDYLAFFNSFDSMQPLYKFARTSNTYYFYDQGQWNQSASTGFSSLKHYLNPKLQWDVNADYNDLIQGWFDNYFRDASEPMKKLFDNIRTHYVYLANETTMNHSIYVEMAKNTFFTRGLLDGWNQLISEAQQSIEYLRTENFDLYMKLHRRIELEFIFVGYVLVEAHAASFSPSDLLELKQRIRNAATNSGVSMLGEVTDISELWARWNLR
jgi:hypothetical protein